LYFFAKLLKHTDTKESIVKKAIPTCIVKEKGLPEEPGKPLTNTLNL